jgi:competence protein ComEC
MAPGPAFFSGAEQLSISFHQYLNRFPVNEAGLMEALVTGADGYLDDSVRVNLRNGGVIHLIAASGMQVQFFAFILALLLRFLPVPRWIQVSILLLVLAFYAAIAGLGVSILRAVIMAAVEALSPYFRRVYDSISSLSFAAIVVLIANPYWAISPGFYLSFGGMLAIILAGAALRNRKPILRETAKGISAAIITLPTTVYFFRGFATYGALSTLALSYPASVLMLLALSGFAVEKTGLWLLQGPVDFVCETVARVFLAVTSWVAELPGAYIRTSEMDPTWAAWTIFFMALIWRPQRIEKPN